MHFESEKDHNKTPICQNQTQTPNPKLPFPPHIFLATKHPDPTPNPDPTFKTNGSNKPHTWHSRSAIAQDPQWKNKTLVRSRNHFPGIWIFTHHERVDKKIIVLERIESRGGIDSVLVVLAELNNSYNCRECTKYKEVEDLHCCYREERETGRVKDCMESRIPRLLTHTNL